jgi:hypothetical protein
VSIDDSDQSQQSGNFMWSAHARARCTELAFGPRLQRFAGEHDGYLRLPEPVAHKRTIEYDEPSGTFVITDELEGTGEHDVARHWHFAEGLEPAVGESGACSVRVGAYTVTIGSLQPPDEARVHRGGAPTEGGWVSRSFGRKTPSTTLEWRSRIKGNATLVTRIRCSKD